MTTILEGNTESIAGHVEAFENLVASNPTSRNLSQVPRISNGIYGDSRVQHIVTMPPETGSAANSANLRIGGTNTQKRVHGSGSVQAITRNASNENINPNLSSDPTLSAKRGTKVSKQKQLNKVALREANLLAGSNSLPEKQQ